uniref:Galectin n=1 Tax=Caenorhabditis tropicalis TaxID=1561998 RepID=A0A1I7U3R1_9PELO
MVSDANPRLKILIDHSLRYFPHFPPAQVTLHLPDDSPADMFAPRQPFDLPIFFYQCCPLEKSIIEADFLSVQSLQLGFNNINKDVEVVLQNYRAVFTVSTEDGTRELTFEEIGTFGQNTYYKHESTELNWDQQYSNESVLIDGSRIMLKDGAIFDYTRNKCIPVYLNNVCIDKMKIEKISIHKFEDRVEVFILFDRFFMARGWIRKPQTGISNSRWICDS